MAETWPSAWRGRAMGIVQSSWAVGYALAAVVAAVVLSRANWRWVFFVGVIPAVLVFGFSGMYRNLSYGNRKNAAERAINRGKPLHGELHCPD